MSEIKATQLIQDLKPYAQMTVVDGVTVGDLAFASAQTFYSTGLIATDSGTANILPANSRVNLFSGAVGSAGAQGYGAAAVLTESETNLRDREGKLGANECFVGIRCGFNVFRRSSNALAASETISHIGTTDGLHGLLDHLTWTWNPGDTIERTIGPIGMYPAGGGVYGHLLGTATGGSPTTEAIAWGATNGIQSPYTLRKLPLPIIWKPQIRTQVKVECGTGFEAYSHGSVDSWDTTDYIGVRMVVQGILFTMPV